MPPTATIPGSGAAASASAGVAAVLQALAAPLPTITWLSRIISSRQWRLRLSSSLAVGLPLRLAPVPDIAPSLSTNTTSVTMATSRCSALSSRSISDLPPMII
uniref:Secreted protein n=1 Tax=Macrostomum lignano TaxID=282301 RepID=A0A1I8GCY1_9PLAT